MQQMTSPLRRINRAKEKLDILNDENNTFITSISDRAFIDKDPNDGQNVLNVELMPLPPEWGFLVGEIAHGFRCALDNIAFNVACVRDERTAFPICKDISKLRGSNKFPKNIWANIEVVQPYNAPQGQRTIHPLWVLRRIDTIDKHRRILPDYFSQIKVFVKGGQPKFIGSIDKVAGFYGGKIQMKSPHYSNLEDNLKPNMTAEVVFDISCPPIDADDPTEIALSHLLLIHNFIRYDIYPRFAKFLRPEYGHR